MAALSPIFYATIFGLLITGMNLGATTLAFNHKAGGGGGGRTIDMSSTFVPVMMIEWLGLGARGINPSAMNPALAMHKMASVGIASMTADKLHGFPLVLVKELGDAIGVKTGFEIGKDGKIIERAFGDYAKAAVLNSAVSTMMSVVVDGQDVGEALRHGTVSAVLNTAG